MKLSPLRISRLLKRRPDPTQTLKASRSSECLVRALADRGISHRYLRCGNRVYIAFTVAGTTYLFGIDGLFTTDGNSGARASIDGAIGNLLRSKVLTKAVLRHHGFSVPDSVAVSRNERDRALVFFETMLPHWPRGACLKPTDGHAGKHVFVGIRDSQGFNSAFNAIAKRHEDILIEEMVDGAVHRFFCIAGRVVAIRVGEPHFLVGDGKTSVAQLVEQKNVIAGRPTHLKPNERAFLAQQGLDPGSIPLPGVIVAVSAMSNLSRGAEIIDVTDDVHSSYIAIVERAIRCFPDLAICAAEMTILNRASEGGAYHFIEINPGPGFEGHHFPSRGKPRDVAGAIVDYLASRAAPQDGHR